VHIADSINKKKLKESKNNFFKKKVKVKEQKEVLNKLFEGMLL
jgi:hypothetical protein